MDEEDFISFDEQIDLDQFIDRGGMFDDDDLVEYRETETYQDLSYRYYA